MSKYDELKLLAQAGDPASCANMDPELVIELITQNEALRKDAERYRWLRKGDDRDEISFVPVMFNRRTGMKVFVTDDYADTQIDAAIARGEQQ